jgi:hypothetical protein
MLCQYATLATSTQCYPTSLDRLAGQPVFVNSGFAARSVCAPNHLLLCRCPCCVAGNQVRVDERSCMPAAVWQQARRARAVLSRDREGDWQATSEWIEFKKAVVIGRTCSSVEDSGSGFRLRVDWSTPWHIFCGDSAGGCVRAVYTACVCARRQSCARVVVCSTGWVTSIVTARFDDYGWRNVAH